MISVTGTTAPSSVVTEPLFYVSLWVLTGGLALVTDSSDGGEADSVGGTDSCSVTFLCSASYLRGPRRCFDASHLPLLSFMSTTPTSGLS